MAVLPVVAGRVPTPIVTPFRVAPLAYAAGQVSTVDATAGFPANVVFANGLPVTPSGQLCTSTGAVASWSNGLPFVANGAVAVS